MPEHTRVLIIGSGPAGLTAAIYSARAQLNPIVIEGEPSSTTDQPGGQLMLTTDVENYPGFPEAITGPELMANMRAQALRFGADLRVNKVQVLDTGSRPFRAWLTDDEEPSITADTVILATGARSLMMGVPGEERLLSRDGLGASKIMQERALANEKIRFAWNTKVTEVLGEDKVSGLAVQDTVSGEDRVLDVTGVFVAIGHIPNTTLVM